MSKTRWLVVYAMLGLCLTLFSACLENDQDEDRTDGDQSGDGDWEAADGDTDTETEAEAEAEAEAVRLVDLVNPFIATGGKGFGVGSGTPAAMAPFGMVKIGPDTSPNVGGMPFYHCSGYYDTDSYIQGFSHVRLYGTGAADYANIMFMPVAPPMSVEKTVERGYHSKFSKKNETAKPGYYAVKLDDVNVRAEFTATPRTAYHRYTFGDDQSQGLIVIDTDHTVSDCEVTDGFIDIDADKKEVTGYSHQNGNLTGRFGGVPIYFVARFSREFASFGTWKEKTLSDAVKHQDGADTGGYLTFDLSQNRVVEIQVGISFVSVEQARLNLETELTDWNFDGVRKATEDQWEQDLSVIHFEGGSEDDRAIMATALYHTMIMPDVFSDVDGQYLGLDKKVHKAEGFTYYTDFSLWDTYRTEHPLLIMVKPERQRDMAISLVKMYEQAGYLPRWPIGSGESGCMIGTSADIVLSETYLKGITDFDVDKAYEAMRKSATGPVQGTGRSGIEQYLSLGYVSVDQSSSVSKTQEYAVADNAIANLAEALGKSEDAALFRNQSKNYRNHWLADSQFFVGRNADGSFVEFNPLKWEEKLYDEGDAWQYLWLAPHDLSGLKDLFGGNEPLLAKLTTFFEEGKKENENPSVGGYLPPAYYWHGNEPDLHASYIFNEAGRPDLTAKWVRWVAKAMYKNAPDGLAGNDDCGTLSAWYVFSAMGFLPIPGATDYLIGTPFFPRMEVKMSGGTLVIEAPEVSETNIYIQSVTLNGAPLTATTLKHADIEKGGVLHFTMGPEPSDWGKPAK